jgi:glutaredoxin
MRLLRWLIGKVILFINAITLPKPIQRDNINQHKLDKETKGLTIYQFEACPFCVKVRRFIRKNNLKINLRDAKNNEIFKSELVNDGGKHKVPCLKIEKTNAKTEWLYESDEIILFLKKIIAS